MGIIRGVLIVFVSILLFLVFVAGNIFFILDLSMDYENIQPQIVSVSDFLIEQQIGMKTEIEFYLDVADEFCEENPDYTFSLEEYTFIVSCSVISQGADAVLQEGVIQIFDKIYYKSYNCEFLECLGQEEVPLVLVSQKANSFWSSKFKLALLIAVALIVLMFFLVSKKYNMLVISGALLTVSSFSALGLQNIFSFFVDVEFLQLAVIFISKAGTVFWISFITGIVLLAAGILLKIFGAGLKIFKEKDQKSKKTEGKK